MLGIDFGIKDAIDILLVALMMYEAFRLLRRSGAGNVFWGILALMVTWLLVSFVFQLELTGAILDRIVSVGAIALIVIFQEEIRSLIYRIGSRFADMQLLRKNRNPESDKQDEISQIVMACSHMSKTKTGALIVLSGDHRYAEYTDSGEAIDARVSARMIEQIFFKNSPLHDGALFVSHGRLQAAACILPVSKNPNLPQHYGLRHRAALGLTEKTDTTCIVVSEETGRISIAHGEEIRMVSEDELLHYLSTSALA